MPKRILITGASGFIGSHMAAKAVKLGYKVTGLDNKDCKVDGIDFIKGDIRDKETVEKAMKGQERVMHLAAIVDPRSFVKDPADCYAINVDGFRNVIDAAHKEGVERFFYASSASIYTDKFSETTTLDFKAQHNHYAKSKMMNEMLADAYYDLYKMSTVGARYFNAFGPGEECKGYQASVVGQFCRYKAEGKPMVILGDGKQQRDYIYIDDIVNLSFMLMDKGTYSIYNVGTGKPIMFNEIANLVDKDWEKSYVPNTLPTYQYYTCADTKRIFETVGDYKFTEVRKAIEETSKKYSLQN